MKPEMLVTRGYPGSGKSTWAKNYVIESEEPAARLNRDDFRQMMFATSETTNSQESAVTVVEQTAAAALLKMGYTVVVDALNLRQRYINKWFEIAAAHDAHFHEIQFMSSPETCVMNLAHRDSAGGRYIAPEVVYDLAKKFPLDKLRPAELKSNAVPVPLNHEERQAPRAVLVDLDGTLAHNTSGRSFFGVEAAQRCGEDEVDETLRTILLKMQPTHKLIFMSGRTEDCRPETVKWLEKHNFYIPTLFMRQDGDTRPDAVVKLELFNTHIRGKYTPVLAFDDRNSIVKLWRDLGIKCFQVSEGY